MATKRKPSATLQRSKSAPTKAASAKAASIKTSHAKAPRKRVDPTALKAPARAKAAGGKSTGKTKTKAKANGQSNLKDGNNDERARELALAIASFGLESKALNVEIIDVHGKVDYSDYVVVMSGRSDRQVNALGRNIEDGVQQKLGQRCLGIEGMPQGTWLLMDYGDVVVHIFHEDTRGYYDLETLWMDAARVAVED